MLPIATDFKTSDTPLAAYLYSIGNQLLRIDWLENKGYFVFKASPELEQAVQNFNMTTAVGNIQAYNNAYRELIKRIKAE